MIRLPRLHRTLNLAAVTGSIRRFASNNKSPCGAGTSAYLPSELPPVMDLFNDFSDKHGQMDKERLAKLLKAVGEPPDVELVESLFDAADVDNSGTICLEEFLMASDTILANNSLVLARCTLVVGGPGSGKGVLCSRLVAECNVAHVSSGDMLREEVAAGTPIGQEAESIMAKGELVPSSLITAMLRRRMRGYGGRRLLLDGFPRSRQNAIDFEAQCGRPELALSLVCPEDVMVERILRRSVIEGRADDNEATARQRIKVFREQGGHTIAWLRERGVPIIELDASGTPDDVWGQLVVVGRLMRPAITNTNAALDGVVEAARQRLNEALRQVDAFAALSDGEIASLRAAMKGERYAQGDWVFKQGESGDAFYVVVGGTANVERRFAGVVATSAEGLQVMRITRATFEKILGPLESRIHDKWDAGDRVIYAREQV